MSTTPSATDSIKHPISKEVREQVFEWLRCGQSPKFSCSIAQLGPFFRQMTSQCHQASDDVAIDSYVQILEIAKMTKNGVTKEDILLKLIFKNQGTRGNEWNTLCENAVDLAVRCLFMLYVGGLQHAYTDRPRMEWTGGTILDLTSELFSSKPVMDHNGMDLGPSFHALNLSRVAGIEIEWTPNLADHLRVDEIAQGTTLYIFHHVTYLQTQQE